MRNTNRTQAVHRLWPNQHPPGSIASNKTYESGSLTRKPQVALNIADESCTRGGKSKSQRDHVRF